MRRLSLLLLILGFSTSPLLATCDRDEIAIHGRVRTATGDLLPGAIVAPRGSATMTTSAPDGQFELCVEARRSLVLVATRRGYSAAEHEVDLVTDRSAINLVMHPTGYFEMVDVTARTQVPERQPVAGSLHATSLDILRTAGTYADALRGAQMMPGVSKVDEGAGLFVRGGDVNETATYLDRALVSHPYRLETPSGGFFGTVPPWLISGMSLSTGGFPARYGNALSGVLELESLPRPEQREILLTAGLAAVSGRISLPLGDAAGLRFSGNRSQTRTLFELNNVEQEFSTYPAATDFNLGAYYESDRLGQLDAFAFRQRNEVGVGLETESFQGLLESQDENNGVSLRWRRTLASCCLATLTASHSDYRQTSAAGRLDIAERERGSRLRFDLDTRAGEWTLRLGAEWEETRFRFAGQAPERGGDLAGLEGVRLWQLDFARQRAGAYVELEREFGRFATNLGFRADHVSRQGFGFDPRFAITWTPRPGHRFRFATGIYHQAPEAQLLDQDFGNPDLELMRSRHLVLGYQYREATDPLHIRVEVYDKDYEHLPLESTELGFSDDGRGWARGLDLLVKGSRGRWSGWMSFGTIDSRRLSTRWIDFGRFPVPDEPVRNPLAVPHTLQLSSEWVLPHGISLAGTYRWAAGQPFTPITGATEVEGRFAPVYGEIGSDEYPDFRRLDLNATKALPFLDSGLAIAFVGISNVFDRQSTFSYVYSADYSSRRPSRTSFGRSLYLGITLIR